MFEGIEVLDAVGIDSLDGHQLSIHQPLASAGYPPRGRRTAIGSRETTVGYAVALRQNATPGGNFLKSM